MREKTVVPVEENWERGLRCMTLGETTNPLPDPTTHLACTEENGVEFGDYTYVFIRQVRPVVGSRQSGTRPLGGFA